MTVTAHRLDDGRIMFGRDGKVVHLLDGRWAFKNFDMFNISMAKQLDPIDEEEYTHHLTPYMDAHDALLAREAQAGEGEIAVNPKVAPCPAQEGTKVHEAITLLDSLVAEIDKIPDTMAPFKFFSPAWKDACDFIKGA